MRFEGNLVQVTNMGFNRREYTAKNGKNEGREIVINTF